MVGICKIWGKIKEEHSVEYGALALGMADELLSHLQTQFAPHDLRFEAVPTVQEANRRLSEKAFHLLIADLEYLRSIGQSTWLEYVRQITFAPLIVLSDTPEQDSGGMVELGADICVSGKSSVSVVVDVAFAQFRRYTEYNHYAEPCSVAAAAFELGDIFIDPPHREVKVRGREIKLRSREFDLLLLFMRNPRAILTTEQICEKAWGMAGSYNRGVAQPIRVLRLAIELDPENPVYIETVRGLGYRFTAHKSGTCDKC